MLRKKLESKSGTKIANSGLLKIYEKPDFGSRIWIAIPDYEFKLLNKSFDNNCL